MILEMILDTEAIQVMRFQANTGRLYFVIGDNSDIKVCYINVRSGTSLTTTCYDFNGCDTVSGIAFNDRTKYDI